MIHGSPPPARRLPDTVPGRGPGPSGPCPPAILSADVRRRLLPRPPGFRILLAALAFLATGPCLGGEGGLVEKKTFSMGAYVTVGGERIPDVKVGYESYGTLSPGRDNVILIPQPFSLSSHAAGRYREEDPRPGYWDALIGPGKGVDTDRFFVISSDSLSNVRPGSPDVVTTGPATLDPETGRPYGLSFPLVTIRDLVEVQKALLASMGIEKLHAVVGASMGAMQALEWAVAHPEAVERVVAVAGIARADAWLIGQAHVRTELVRSDPAWRGGDYYGHGQPVDGLALALKHGLMQSRHPGWASRHFDRRWADPGRDPASALSHRFAIEAWLDDTARAAARRIDANSFLYLVKAIQLFVAGHAGSLQEGLSRVKAEVFFIPMASDLIFFPEYSREAAEILRAQGKEVRYQEVEGDAGHADDTISITQVAEEIRAFLEN